MLRKVIPLTILLLAPLTMFAQKLEISDNVIDLKSVDKGSKTYRNIQFKNTGDKPLLILGYTTVCGCTKIAFSREPVQPGATGTIRLMFSAKDPGAFYKKVRISSNGPETEFAVKGIVKTEE